MNPRGALPTIHLPMERKTYYSHWWKRRKMNRKRSLRREKNIWVKINNKRIMKIAISTRKAVLGIKSYSWKMNNLIKSSKRIIEVIIKALKTSSKS